MVLGTEFGRTFRINDNDGRDKHDEVVASQVMIALLADRQTKRLLDQTLVVLGTDFVRKPRINDGGRRDQIGDMVACWLTGTGIRGGQAYGKTDGWWRSASPTCPGSGNRYRRCLR